MKLPDARSQPEADVIRIVAGSSPNPKVGRSRKLPFNTKTQRCRMLREPQMAAMRRKRTLQSAAADDMVLVPKMRLLHTNFPT